MKKKSMMLGGLLAAVVVTAYSVSGTYAKYISEIDLADEARVARWELTTDQGEDKTIDLFGKVYNVKSDGTTGTFKYVEATENVVAPGTTGSYTFEFGGNFETAYNLEVFATLVDESGDIKKYEDGTYDLDDVVLYYTLDDKGNPVKAAKNDADTTVKNYHPIKYTLVNNTDSTTIVDGGDILALKAGLDGLSSQNNEPGTLTTKSYTISWKWASETGDNATEKAFNNKLDTLLGNNYDAETSKIRLNLNIKATQVTDGDNLVSNK